MFARAIQKPIMLPTFVLEKNVTGSDLRKGRGRTTPRGGPRRSAQTTPEGGSHAPVPPTGKRLSTTSNKQVSRKELTFTKKKKPKARPKE